LRAPVLISGFPGLGSTGKIAIRYLINQLSAPKRATLFSSFFPPHVLVDSVGKIRLPSVQFYSWQNIPSEQSDLIFVTSDCQAESYAGQYTIVTKILEYAQTQKIETIIALGGFRAAVQSVPSVICLSSNLHLQKTLLAAGAHPSPPGNPIVGMTGLLMGLSEFSKINIAGLLGKIGGYAPELHIIQNLLEVLAAYLHLELDYSALQTELQRLQGVYQYIDTFQQEIETMLKERAEIEGDTVPYIS
jgi:proteasome assembly chaperone (PAC2) family protein